MSMFPPAGHPRTCAFPISHSKPLHNTMLDPMPSFVPKQPSCRHLTHQNPFSVSALRQMTAPQNGGHSESHPFSSSSTPLDTL
eukprot:605673-Pelagomonas_calceolata.AAC.1